MHSSITELFDLTGEVAVVTGGLGLLGSEYVKTLARAGASVAIFDISKKTNEKIDVLKKEGLPVSIHEVDITNKEAVKTAFAEVKKEFGIPTILINNAGIDALPSDPISVSGPYEDFPEEVWDRVLDSHLKGAHTMSQEFLREIRTTDKKGSIINISSIYGVVSPDQSVYDFRRKNGEQYYKPVAYSVAKSGVLNFTRWLAEYCGYNNIPVRINTLAIGGVYNGQPDEFLKEYNRRAALGRMVNVDECNATILLLSSYKASSAMTGSLVMVDAGWTVC